MSAISIKTLDDVLPAVEGRRDFVVARKDGYTVVDYVYAGADTFDDPVRRECRGIKFDAAGRILARPLHKFFNVNELPETQSDAIDWSRPHVVTEKLDGSMVHPILLPNEKRLRWATRMGVTDVAERAAERIMTQWILGTALHMHAEGLTPCFEWTSPANRIVVSHDMDRAHLLAARDIVTGEYLDRETLSEFAKDAGVPLPTVLATDAYGDWKGLARHVEDLEDAEGYVVWFLDGLEPRAVKVKAPLYVTRHRALDGLRFEHNVVRLVVEGAVDDVLPILDARDWDRLDKFRAALNMTRASAVDGVRDLVDKVWETRKDFALFVRENVQRRLQGVAFAVYDGRDAREAVDDAILKACGNQKDCAEMLTALGAKRWI